MKESPYVTRVKTHGQKKMDILIGGYLGMGVPSVASGGALRKNDESVNDHRCEKLNIKCRMHVVENPRTYAYMCAFYQHEFRKCQTAPPETVSITTDLRFAP